MSPPPKANSLRRREFKRILAKELRVAATPAERKLWSLLRSGQLASIRFRRQQPIGPYIADFFCPAAKIIIELDGAQHGSDRNITYDEKRTNFLKIRGYRVLRFSNGDVLKNPYLVLETVWRAFAERRPLPDPP